MNAQSPADPAAISPASPQAVEPTPGQQRAAARLQAIRRALQSLAKRKLRAFEQDALETAARLAFRAEVASLDIRSDSNDVVRLSNAARRARADYLRIAGIVEHTAKPKRKPSMADLEAELAHG